MRARTTKAQQIHALLFAQLAKQARKSFIVYLLLMNPPGAGRYIMGKLHAFLATLCQEMVDGKRHKRQIVNVPPQHGKSTLLSQEFVSWVIAYDPGIEVALTGFSYRLLTDFSKWIRRRVQSKKYQMIFPEVQIRDGDDRSDAWALTNESSVRAHSVGQPLTGRPVKLLIIDDPHSGRLEAESPVMRKRVVDWYIGNCITRLTPDGMVMIIHTRWHPEDLSGYLMSDDYRKSQEDEGLTQELFEKTNLQAISTEEEEDPLGRGPNEALFPEVRNLDFLRALRAAMQKESGDYEWESQYQGNPMTAGSGQADVAKILKVKLEDVPRDCEWVRAWDLAVTDNKTSDFSSGMLMAYDIKNDIIYLVDRFRDRMIWPKLKPKILSIARRDVAEFGVSRTGIEGVSGFRIGFHEIQQELRGEMKVEMHNPGKFDKLVRAQPWLNKVEAGKVRMVEGDWNRAFINELKMFPEGTHDDQVDTVSIGFEMFKKRVVLYA